MKTKSKILITLLIAALCMPAQAQFGGLLNKAKEKAKEAVTKEAKKTVEKKVVRNSGVEESASSSADAQNAPTATSNPNAKDIDPILGVSMSALNESYKKLDFNTYYTLFYDEPGMFYTKSFDETQKVHNLMEQFVIYLMSSGKDSPPMCTKQKETGTYFRLNTLLIPALPFTGRSLRKHIQCWWKHALCCMPWKKGKSILTTKNRIQW